MLDRGHSPLLNTNAIKKPLAYEHAVDAAVFLGASEREFTNTEHLAAAYYLQQRTSQLIGNIAFTGQDVAEKVEEMIENVQNAGFLRSLVNDYQAAKEPQISLAEIRETYKPDMSRQPKIRQVLKGAVIFSPIAFLIDFEGFGEVMSQPTSQRIIATMGGSLLAGYATALRQKRFETREHDDSAGSFTKPSEQPLINPVD